MPVGDECKTELDLFEAKWDEADEICNLAEEARMAWEQALETARAECEYLGNLGGGFNGLLEDLPEEERNRILDKLEQDIQNCMNQHPDVIDAWNLYEELGAACDATIEAAEVQQEAYETCLHALHDSMPFA